MEVTIETTKGRRFTIEVWYFSTVSRIKEYILKQEGIPVESQRLFFQGKELQDDHDTEHYSILQGSHVLLVLPDDAPAPSPAAAAVVHVVASAPSRGRSVALELEASCTVARLKEKLHERTDGALPAARLSVFFGKAEMEDDKALSEFDPPADGMEVRVVVRQPPPAPPVCGNGATAAAAAKIINSLKLPRMPVEVKWGATMVTLEVSDMVPVKELRTELGRAVPHLLLPNDGGYFFIHKQNVMEEDRTLRWHDVKSGDTIEIFNGRVTGGG